MKKIKFNENLILIVLGIVTFVLGINTVGFVITMAIVIAFVIFAGIYLNDLHTKLWKLLTTKPRKKKKPAKKGAKGKTSAKSKGSNAVRGKGKGKGRQKRKNKLTKKQKFFRIFGFFVLGGGVLAFAATLVVFAIIAATTPAFDPQELYAREQTVLFDKDGESFATLGVEQRENVAFNELPQVLVDAIVATEDSRFFQHNGFDLPRFARASFGQATGNRQAGGASTITMQIAKNAFTSTEVSVWRKLQDIYISIFRIERRYSKEQIMEFYVNIPFLGSNSFGVKQAARTYFNKPIGELNLSEAATIAGLFQSPSALNPHVHPERAERRRNIVLGLMERHGYITAEERRLAEAIPVEALLAERPTQTMPHQAYIDTVVEEIIAKTGNNPYNVSMLIYTNMDRRKQQWMDDIMEGRRWNWRDNQVQAGATVVNIHTGGIEAIAAGRNRVGERSFNHATMLNRQPGSTSKPFFGFGPGIEYENWSTYTPFTDRPHTYSDGTRVTNWDNRYRGFMTSRVALAQSRNIPAVKAFQANNNANIVEFVTRLGLNPEINRYGRIHEAHSIGGYNGESPTSLVGAYAAFGNGGFFIRPHAVNRIVYRDTGESVDMRSNRVRAMSEATAFMVTDMLVSAVTDGLSSRQRMPGVQIAAKTGTSNFDRETIRRHGLRNAVNDLWECAYTPETAICLWYGYQRINSRYHNRSGDGRIRSELLRTMTEGVFERTGSTFRRPDSVVPVRVVMGSNPPMAATSGGILEYFRRGHEPRTRGDTAIPNVTNLRGTFESNSNTVRLNWNHPGNLANITEAFANTPGMGNIGYEVFIGNRSVGFTENNTFTYTLSRAHDSITFVVRTTFSGSRSMRSSGASVTVQIGTAPTTGTFTCELNDADPLEVGANVFTTTSDPGIRVYRNGTPFTNVTVRRDPSTAIGPITDPVVATYTAREVGTNRVLCTATRTFIP